MTEEDQIFDFKDDSKKIFTLRNLAIGAGVIVVVVICAVVLHFQFRTKESSSVGRGPSSCDKSTGEKQATREIPDTSDLKGFGMIFPDSSNIGGSRTKSNSENSFYSEEFSHEDDSEVDIDNSLMIENESASSSEGIDGYFFDEEAYLEESGFSGFNGVNLDESLEQKSIYQGSSEILTQEDFESQKGSDQSLTRSDGDETEIVEDFNSENSKVDIGCLVKRLFSESEDEDQDRSSFSFSHGQRIVNQDDSECEDTIVSVDMEMFDEDQSDNGSDEDQSHDEPEAKVIQSKSGCYSFTFVLEDGESYGDAIDAIKTGIIEEGADGSKQIEYEFISEDIEKCGEEYLKFLRASLEKVGKTMVLYNDFGLSPSPDELFKKQKGHYLLPVKTPKKSYEIRAKSIPGMIELTKHWENAEPNKGIDFAELFKNMKINE